MARLTGLTTQLKGSAGAWTFYERLGNTVAKQKVDNRPRRRMTDSQLEHCLCWSNLVNFWSETQGCLRDAFEHKRGGQTDFNMFMSHNMTRRGVYLPYQMAQSNACVVAPFIVSVGGLMPVEVVEAADGRMRTDIHLGEGFVLTPETTVGDVSHAIVLNNSDFRHGDTLFCLAAYHVEDSFDGYPHVNVCSARLKIDAYDSSPLANDKNLAAAFSSVEGFVGVDSPMVGGITWIHTRQLRSRLAVSSQHLALSGITETPYTTPEAIAAAIKSYRPHIPAPAG